MCNRRDFQLWVAAFWDLPYNSYNLKRLFKLHVFKLISVIILKYYSLHIIFWFPVLENDGDHVLK
jgi:hypothetical protein